MGLIRALTTGVSTVVGDQFKEYVVCPTIEKDVLIQRGEVKHGSGNTNPTPGIISNGSKIVVPQGMAMMLIQNGEIKEFTAEAGEFTWDSGSEPSIFTGGLWNGIVDSFKNIGKRFSYGGLAPTDQRVYYVNLLAVTGNKFGSPQPRKITDDKYGMLEVTFFGEYAFQVKDPIVLVQNVIGANPKDTITYDEVVGSQLKGKFVEQVSQALSVVMRKHHIPFGDIGMYNSDIAEEMNTILDESWRQKYGLEITDVAIIDINLTEESMKRVSTIDDATIFSNPNLQSGLMAKAGAEALTSAASNPNGAMMGFMGMNMANAGGATMMGAVNQNVNNNTEAANTYVQPEPGTLFGVKSEVANEETVAPVQETPVETQAEDAPNFCPNCGAKTTGGNFCQNCGNKLA